MTVLDELLRRIGKVTAKEAREAIGRFNNSHWNRGGEYARCSIPARPEYDDDIRLSAYVDQAEARIRELEAVLRTQVSYSNDYLEETERALYLKINGLEERISELEAENKNQAAWLTEKVARIRELDGEWEAQDMRIRVKTEYIARLVETLRGIRQEKQAVLDETPTFHPMRKEREKQIAWIDRVLRGEP